MINGIGGSFDPQQMAQLMFKKIDTDGNGSISKTELQTLMKDKVSKTEEIDELFTKIDTDGSGEISLAENEEAMKNMPKPSKPNIDKIQSMLSDSGISSGNLKSLFDILKKIDSNSSDESVSYTNNQGPPDPQKMAQSILKALDSDENGSISKTELQTYMKDNNIENDDIDGLFTSIDADGNGEINLAEIGKTLKSMAPPPPPPPSDSSTDTTDTSISSLTSGSSSTSNSSSSSALTPETLKSLFDLLQKGISADSSNLSDAEKQKLNIFQSFLKKNLDFSSDSESWKGFYLDSKS